MQYRWRKKIEVSNLNLRRRKQALVTSQIPGLLRTYNELTAKKRKREAFYPCVSVQKFKIYNKPLLQG